MAKKINDTEATDTPDVKVSDTQPESAPPASSPAPETKPEKKAKEDALVEIPDHADRILRTFTNYSSLYIDFQGGTFTVDTPPSFRSDATLYRNPYYKKP